MRSKGLVVTLWYISYWNLAPFPADAQWCQNISLPIIYNTNIEIIVGVLIDRPLCAVSFIIITLNSAIGRLMPQCPWSCQRVHQVPWQSACFLQEQKMGATLWSPWCQFFCVKNSQSALWARAASFLAHINENVVVMLLQSWMLFYETREVVTQSIKPEIKIYKTN